MNNPINRELLRIELLRRACNSAPQAVTVRIFMIWLRGVFAVSEDTVVLEAQYLMDKGLLTPAAKTLSPENKAWHVSAAGRDFLAEQGLE